MTRDRVEVAFPSDPSTPRRVREWIQKELRSAVADARTIDDLRLIASELCSNAVEHISASMIVVRMQCHDPDFWILEFTTHTEDPSPPHSSNWMVASPDAASGRGLGIVRSLCERVDVEVEDGAVTVVCHRRREP